ncbi:hypothetical protein IE53DRAFT_110352 [Violaceomyces palustris]|uniref:Uncharacterized protein n=1 Tax=Violaceomyces palustris TaxID=1673888 RepID=A0ACD0NWM3_9BASI|nr:hypothetical protein IE53DRAFT_110352 [Violaceomyces palustris]
MSQCPLGFKGAIPKGHPPIPGAASSGASSPSDASSEAQQVKGNDSSQARDFISLSNPNFLILLDVAFLLAVVLLVRNWDRVAHLARGLGFGGGGGTFKEPATTMRRRGPNFPPHTRWGIRPIIGTANRLGTDGCR